MPVITPLKIKLQPGIVSVDPKLPASPELRALADDVIAKLKLSLAMAAGGRAPGAAGSADRMFRSYVASRPAAVQERMRERSAAMLASPEVLRRQTFGRFAGLDASHYAAIGSDAAERHLGKMSLSGASTRTSLARLTELARKLPAGFKPIDADVVAGAAFKNLELVVRSVTCVEETDEVGSDEIALGGTIVLASGNTQPVREFMVSDDFDQGEKVSFPGGGRVFGRYPLERKAVGFPYCYSAVVVMAEKDDSGFRDFLAKLWAEVDQEVGKRLVELGITVAGALIGSAFPGIGTVIGAAVGALIAWITSLFDNPDDIVATHTLQLWLGAATRSYYDWAQLTAPGGLPVNLNFNGDGGRYKMALAYRVTA